MLNVLYSFLCVCLLANNPVLAAENIETTSVVQLKDAQLKEFIQKANKPVIVDFWASWCGPCMKMKPVFEQVANELKDQCYFVSINIETDQQIAKDYGLKSIPTFLVFKEGSVIATLNGYIAKEALLEQIQNIIQDKLTITTLFSAVQANDKEMVAKCLADKNIDVNGIVNLNVLDVSVPMTPLMMGISVVLFGQASSDIVVVLLKAGANLDQEVDTPTFDNTGAVTGWTKISARAMVVESAKGLSQEQLEAIDNEAVLQKVLEYKANAINLLELIQNFFTHQS